MASIPANRADMSNKKTEDANHNSRLMPLILHEFRQRRMSFVARLEALNERKIALTAIHPRLNQPMRLVDMVFFTAEHDDHHLARISRLAASGQ